MEQKLKQRMLDESEWSMQMKEEIWNELEAKLESEQQQSSNTLSRDRRKRKPMRNRAKKWTAGVAVVVLVAAVFFSMPAGTAFMKELRLWLAPEKKVEVEVEGSKEETQQELHLNEESHYAIYYDVDRYKLVQQDGKDIITTKEPLPAKYPEVSLVIEQNKDMLPEELIAQIAKDLAGQYSEVREIEPITEPFKGYRVSAIAGQNFDSKVTYVYVTDNGKQGSFALSLNYFLEAAEGHGARFRQMLDEFRVVEEE
jgi:hypothetical protein